MEQTSGGDSRVAVVIITYNRAHEVLRALGHLARLPERPRTVVVDNGSTDGTAALVAERFPQVEILGAGGNLGAAGRTLGVRHVSEPYVAFCDDDTWWDPGNLRAAADLFDAHPQLAVVTARVIVEPQGEEDPICRELERSPLPRTPEMPGPPLLGFLAGASMVRRSAFLEAGGFDSRLGIGGEEEWLAVEFAARGWWMCYISDLVVHHHPSTQRDPQTRRWQGVRNALWFAWLRRPWPGALRRTLELAKGLPRDRAARRGFAAALAALPRLIRDRRAVPPDVERQIRILEAAHTADAGAPAPGRAELAEAPR